MKKQGALVFLVSILISACCISPPGTGESGPTDTPVIVSSQNPTSIVPTETKAVPLTKVADLYKEADEVWHNIPGNNNEKVSNPTDVHKGDAIWTMSSGKALLKYIDPPQLFRLYYDGQMQVTDCIGTNICIGVAIGTVLFGGMSSSGPSMVRTEDGSQIIVTGTTFMVSFFPDQKITLVRVFNGELKFSNSQGNSITLRTNQWGIIEKGQSPIPSEDMKLLRDIARYLDVYNLYHEIELDVQKGFGPEGVALTPVQVEIVFQEELVLDGLLQNVDLTGLNLPGQPIQLAEANPQLCQEACASTPNCASFTYTSGGSCWLKSGVPRQISSLCCISGIVRQDIQPPVIKALKSEPSGPQVCIDQNPDVKFYSIMTDNSIVDTASLYYTFSPFADSNPSQGTQTMGLTNNQFLTSLSFSEGGNLEFEGQAVDPSNNTASTGKIQLTLWDCTGLEFNTDRMGLDISRDNVPFTTTDPQSCRQACQNDPDCMAFSYVEGNQLCWIKFGVPLPRKSMNIISGVVRPDQVPPLISEPVSSSSSSFGTGCHEGPATFITVDIFDKSNMNNALIQVRQGEGYGWITIPMWQISSAVEGNQVRYQYQVDVLGYVSYGWQYKILATDVYGNYRESIIYTIMQIIC